MTQSLLYRLFRCVNKMKMGRGLQCDGEYRTNLMETGIDPLNFISLILNVVSESLKLILETRAEDKT